MLKFHASACIEAPGAQVWERLVRLEDISLWTESVLSAHCEAGCERGVGAERVCRLRGDINIRERWTAWHEGLSFTYEGFDIPLVKRAQNTWKVEPVGDKTLITSDAELELKGGHLGRLLEPLFARLVRRSSSDAMAAFKYLVEQGKSYTGRHSRLPRSPASC